MDIYLIVINLVIGLHYLSADTGKFLFFISSSIRAQLFRTSLNNEVVNRGVVKSSSTCTHEIKCLTFCGKYVLLCFCKTVAVILNF